MSNIHRKSKMGSSRDLGMDSAAGKGDADRVSDVAAYRSNYDEIDWKRPKVFPHFDRVDWCGPAESWDR